MNAMRPNSGMLLGVLMLRSTVTTADFTAVESMAANPLPILLARWQLQSADVCEDMPGYRTITSLDECDAFRLSIDGTWSSRVISAGKLSRPDDDDVGLILDCEDIPCPPLPPPIARRFRSRFFVSS